MKNYKLFIILGFVLFFFWMTFGSNSGVKIKPRDSPPTFIPVRPSSDISLTYNPVRTFIPVRPSSDISLTYNPVRTLIPVRPSSDIPVRPVRPVRRYGKSDVYIAPLVPQYMRNYDPHIGVIPLPGTGYGGWLGAEAGISTSDDEFVSDEENLY
jgi:hypothetical protein